MAQWVGDEDTRLLYVAWKKGNLVPDKMTPEQRRVIWEYVLNEALEASRKAQKARERQLELTNEWNQGRLKVVQLIARSAKTMPQPTLEKELTALINRFSQESESNTPDFVLAQYLLGCLQAWNIAVAAREKWYGRSGTAPATIEQQEELFRKEQ